MVPFRVHNPHSGCYLTLKVIYYHLYVFLHDYKLLLRCKDTVYNWFYWPMAQLCKDSWFYNFHLLHIGTIHSGDSHLSRVLPLRWRGRRHSDVNSMPQLPTRGRPTAPWRTERGGFVAPKTARESSGRVIRGPRRSGSSSFLEYNDCMITVDHQHQWTSVIFDWSKLNQLFVFHGVMQRIMITATFLKQTGSGE